MAFAGNRSHGALPGLAPYSEYTLTVNVFNRKGNGPPSDPVTFVTPEGVPAPVPILTASNAQLDSISLVWGPPLESNGVLHGYLLKYQLVNESTMEVDQPLLEVNISGADTTQWRLEGLEEGALYRFLLSACTRTGCGPPLAQEGSTPTQSRVTGRAGEVSKVWLIGTMCAVALFTLVALAACFVRRNNKGGKYAGTPRRTDSGQVKDKEDRRADLESPSLNPDHRSSSEYSSDGEEKPLRGGSQHSTSLSDEGLEFNEDGSFIGEYSGHARQKASSNQSLGPVLAPA